MVADAVIDIGVDRAQARAAIDAGTDHPSAGDRSHCPYRSWSQARIGGAGISGLAEQSSASTDMWAWFQCRGRADTRADIKAGIHVFWVRPPFRPEAKVGPPKMEI